MKKSTRQEQEERRRRRKQEEEEEPGTGHARAFPCLSLSLSLCLSKRSAVTGPALFLFVFPSATAPCSPGAFCRVSLSSSTVL